MNKRKNPVNFEIFKLWLIVLNIFLMPPIIYAADFYQCRDQAGNESLVDFPIDGQDCKKVGTFEENTVAEKDSKATTSANNNITKVKVIRNQVLVPVTFVYENREVNATLLMDTGAQGTLIHTNVTDQFYINLWKTKKTKAQVVGGGIVDINLIKMDIIKIGPHEIHNKYVGVVDQEGPKVKYDGLLGMDILQSLGYELDLTKKIIIWK